MTRVLAVFLLALPTMGAGLSPSGVVAQVTLDRYERAFAFEETFGPLVVDLPGPARWIGDSHRFWYRTTVEGGHRFHLVDAPSQERRDAFDHARLAAALSEAAELEVSPLDLPFSTVTFLSEEDALEFEAWDHVWRCDLRTYHCQQGAAVPLRPDVNPVGIVHRGPEPQAVSSGVVPSPDGRWEAFIQGYNVQLRNRDTQEEVQLSWDGDSGRYYTFESLAWAPDSRALSAYRLHPGQRRILRYIESAPAHQLQPEYSTLDYTKPGDPVDQRYPALFDVEEQTQIPVDETLIPNQFQVSPIEWREDGRAFTFEYNQRNHTLYQVIEVDARTGEARPIITEEAETFFFYEGRYRGKYFRHDVNDGDEIIWMSERDGWNHLYLYDGRTGELRNQITQGEWVVRDVDRIDEEARQIWFHASGMNPEQDPYFIHYYRIDFDGSNLVTLTEADADHQVVYSEDLTYYVQTQSRVDRPPVMELRRTSDRSLLMALEETDISQLQTAGWRAPEAFSAPGRDGETEIWGVIFKPTDFDPDRSYPVIESIYAGPQSASVPKSFRPIYPQQALAELGFIVAQIDGMGTSYRSKAFHDVAYQNLHDAGFPDRILWHQALAQERPYYDISQVGIYGGSAGGYAATAGILHHPEFYSVAVASNGNHDHRMDKISFNELFMGWPVGPQYALASNAENAWRLQGKLLLTVGEMDHNVDPASTFQVVDVLIRSNRTFDLLVFPGGGHGAGGDYGLRARYDYFVRHLKGEETPNWNEVRLDGHPTLQRAFPPQVREDWTRP